MTPEERKRAQETTIVEMAFNLDEFTEVQPGERPDFTLRRTPASQPFGVEVTQLFPNESLVRLNLVHGYHHRLWSGQPHLHRDDQKVLPSVKVQLRDPAGNVKATLSRPTVYRAVTAQLGARPVDATSATELAGHRDTRSVLPLGLAIFAASLAVTALFVAATLAANRDFEWKTFIVLVGVTAAFAAGAAACDRLLPADDNRRWLTSLLATLAIFGLGLTLLPWDKDPLVYLAGLVMLAGGIVGYWLLKGELLTVAAVLGGFVLLAQVLSDLYDTSDGDSGDVLAIGMFITVYGVAVVGAGWRFSCRHLTGMLGGVIALGGMYGVVYIGGFAFSLVAALGPTPGETFADLRGDLRIAMFVGLLVALGLAVLYVYTGYRRYAVLSFLGAAFLPIVAIMLASREHPLRWGAGFGAVGVLALAAVVWWMFSKGRGAAPATPHTPPTIGR